MSELTKLSSVSPLMAALLDVDCASRLLMRHAGSSRQKEELRDAMADLRAKVLDVVAHNLAEGGAELDVEIFKAIIRLAASRGKWQEFSIAFNQVAREAAS